MGGSMRTTRRHVTLGLLRLTDAAPLIVAKELGTFAEEGLDVELSIEPSWANVADKIVYGLLDGAVMLPPLALAVTLGLRGAGGGGSTRPALAVVHGYSTHNLLLLYWLAAGGLDPDRDVELTVVPPAQVVDV